MTDATMPPEVAREKQLVMMDYMLERTRRECDALGRRLAVMERLRHDVLRLPGALAVAPLSDADKEATLTAFRFDDLAENIHVASLAATDRQRNELVYWAARRAGTLDTAVGQYVLVQDQKILGPFAERAAVTELAVKGMMHGRNHGFLVCVGHEQPRDTVD